MAYLALYRKYRPLTFDKVVGQAHITKTLSNQIALGQIGHAYLLCGTRGTGKTTTARIFAKAINCENPNGGSPCGVCNTCVELSKPNNMDILEIDAASNNRVDDVRNLIEKVNYAPVIGKYKVYIIDEVHMLSDGAFNALLKTLEEPPKHVVFLLGTTEPQKLPQTILSRCMRFDFVLVSVSNLCALMADILMEIGKQFDAEALNAIAVGAEGSVRDALSILDRCVTFSQSKLTYEDVAEVLGSTGREVLFGLAQAIFSKDISAVMLSIDDIVSRGKSIAVLTKDIATHMRDALVAKSCKDSNAILRISNEWHEKLLKQAENVSTAKLLFAINVFASLENTLRFALSSRICFESACLKVLQGSGEVDMDAVDLRIRQLEKRGVAPLNTNTGNDDAHLEKGDHKDVVSAKKIWSTCLKKIREQNSMVLSTVCVEIAGMYVLKNTFVLVCNQSQFAMLCGKENFLLLENIVKESSGLVLKLEEKVEEKSNIDHDIKDLALLLGKENLKII